MSDRSIRVLVVEDNPTDALLVRAALEGSRLAKFEVKEADSLSEAMRCICEESFDVVLLDLGLPDSYGIETYHKIRAASPPHAPAIIVVSGLHDEAVAVEALKAGAQDYLLKTYQMSELLPRSIRYAIERKRAQDEIERYALALRAKNKELEDEVCMAREIQQALLPHQYPHFTNSLQPTGDALHFCHCYRPASSLSGDFFDVLQLSENEAGVFICDVMGHGLRAALIGALTRGLIEQLRPVATDPGKFLSGLNTSLSAILKHTGINAFVTAFYLVTDLERARLRYANAGHPSPLLLHRDAGTVERLRAPIPSRNPPLGLIGDFTYPTFERGLAANNSIVMFTDGLYEAENPREESYSRQRLLSAVRRRVSLPCEQLFEEVVAEIQEFSGRDDFDDDVCMVGIDVLHTGHPVSDSGGVEKHVETVTAG
ncbi:PP2C family protein-serine/threonine phosphatase [Verrucomicrobiota bacterium sgz303538]